MQEQLALILGTMMIRASSPVDSWSPIEFTLCVQDFWDGQGYSHEQMSVGKKVFYLKPRSKEEGAGVSSNHWGIWKFTRVLSMAIDLAFDLLFLLCLQLTSPAQMVGRNAFDAHVLGSIPGVCILLFSWLFQVNPMQYIIIRLPYTLSAWPLDA